MFCAALCVLNGAFIPAVAKLTTGQVEPLLVAAITSVWAGLCAGLILGVRGELRFLLHRRIGVRLLAASALGTAAAYYLFFQGASRASAIETVLCLQSEPAYSLLLAWGVLGHRPTARRIAAIGVLLAGITLAVGASRLSMSSGVWILLATPLCWQLSHLIVLRTLRGVAPSVLTGARFIDGGVLLVVLWAANGGTTTLPDVALLLKMMPLLAVQGVILSYVGTLLWYQAMIRLDLGRVTAIIVPSVPLVSLGASFVLLGEVPSMFEWLGLGLTVTGVFVFVTAPHAHERRRPARAAADAVPIVRTGT